MIDNESCYKTAVEEIKSWQEVMREDTVEGQN